ncbi:gliding motility protein GldL [Flavobacterium sp. SM15]|uniref:gliding motility protein GldL n=1 Tax=Flavobacterium sp. SM15 TaxID=2908005 RepID=UPI001EDBA43D|nr:gliding motility protein GldL [Flavobacterium sp. SM15]MCG2611540.1 gliding motility protein GldL [Flavobacterium sp. SM15]
MKSIRTFFILGLIIASFGFLSKIMHWPYATILLIFGMFFLAIAGIKMILKIYNDQNPNGLFKK